MSKLNGKWKRVRTDNADALVKELVGSDAQKSALLKGHLEADGVIEELCVESNKWSRKTFVNGQIQMDVHGIFDVEDESDTVFGKSKVLAKVLSNSCVEVKDIGLDHPSSTLLFTLKDGKMVLEQTAGTAKCTRYHEKC